jgi:hypothetical protein
MKNVIAIMVVALVLPAGVVMAQTPEERIESAMTRASEAGIPVSLLQLKVDEGKAKGIPMARIAEAVENRAAALVQAQQALSGVPDVEPADLDVAASAYQSGVATSVLSALAEAARGEQRVAALAALEYLVTELGHTPQEAFDKVSEALKRGPDTLASLPADAAHAGRSNITLPGAAGAMVPTGVPAGVPAPGAAPQGGRPAGLPGQ